MSLSWGAMASTYMFVWMLTSSLSSFICLEFVSESWELTCFVWHCCFVLFLWIDENWTLRIHGIWHILTCVHIMKFGPAFMLVILCVLLLLQVIWKSTLWRRPVCSLKNRDSYFGVRRRMMMSICIPKGWRICQRFYSWRTRKTSRGRWWRMLRWWKRLRKVMRFPRHQKPLRMLGLRLISFQIGWVTTAVCENTWFTSVMGCNAGLSFVGVLIEVLSL